MKINQLRIEPHVVKADPTKDNYAPKDGMVLWKIWIDDTKITDTAYPFDENVSLVELFTDIQYPYFLDGKGRVSVRYVQNHIIWSGLLPSDDYSWGAFDLKDGFYVFDAEHYRAACWSAIIETKIIRKDERSLTSDKSWQFLDFDELVVLLKARFPESYVAIYREPAYSQDRLGSFLLRRMEHAIQSITKFSVCDPPDKQIELRIGLDESEFTEAIWHIGKVNGKFAIYFEHRPYFPAWLQSDVFDKVLIQEPFSKDL